MTNSYCTSLKLDRFKSSHCPSRDSDSQASFLSSLSITPPECLRIECVSKHWSGAGDDFSPLFPSYLTPADLSTFPIRVLWFPSIFDAGYHVFASFRKQSTSGWRSSAAASRAFPTLRARPIPQGGGAQPIRQLRPMISIFF